MKMLLILNGPACESDKTFNALRLALALAKRQDVEPHLFLIGDGVACAVAGQKTPNGYYTVDRMLRSFGVHKFAQGVQLVLGAERVDGVESNSHFLRVVRACGAWGPSPSSLGRSALLEARRVELEGLCLSDPRPPIFTALSSPRRTSAQAARG